jgi:hypothetical protein
MNSGTWLQDHPRILEGSYRFTRVLVKMLYPFFRLIGLERADRWLRPMEHWSKDKMFGCKMCGQCVLSTTGMTCPMTCPKELRNGACGGVLSNGNCEVIPEMKCVWVQAYERACDLNVFGPEIIDIKPPLNHRLEGSSAWINMLTKDDIKGPKGWSELPHNPVIERKLLHTTGKV